MLAAAAFPAAEEARRARSLHRFRRPSRTSGCSHRHPGSRRRRPLDSGALDAVPPGRLGGDLRRRRPGRLRGDRSAHGGRAVRVPDPDPRGPGRRRRDDRLHHRRQLGHLSFLLPGWALPRIPPGRGGETAGLAPSPRRGRGLPAHPCGKRRALLPLFAGQPKRRVSDDRSRNRRGKEAERGEAGRRTGGPRTSSTATSTPR